MVDSVAKALGILDCFSKEETELSLNQLCEKTGLYKSRVHRLCGTLGATGYLVKTANANYRLGPKLMALGKVYENTNSLRSIAAPFMQQLSSETGQSTALFVIDGIKCICMAREMGSARLVYSISEGDYLTDLVSTASGRVLLAFADKSIVDRALARAKNSKSAEKKIIDKEEFKEQLMEVREKGYSINKKGLEPGVAAIAAPIYDVNHDAIAALAIVGNVHNFTDEQCDVMLQSLLAATKEISRLMGGTKS